MKRVDSDGATAEGLFQDKNVETGTPGTELESTWHNAVQEEICGVIEARGLVLSSADNTQLLQAINLTNSQHPATFIVAASNARTEQKNGADYICDGTGDEVQINAAITAANALGGGTVVLTQGNFFTGTYINLKSGVALIGSMYGTILKPATGFGATRMIYCENNSSVESMVFDGDGVTLPSGFTVISCVAVTESNLNGSRIKNITIQSFYAQNLICIQNAQYVENPVIINNTGKGPAGVGVNGFSGIRESIFVSGGIIQHNASESMSHKNYCISGSSRVFGCNVSYNSSPSSEMIGIGASNFVTNCVSKYNTGLTGYGYHACSRMSQNTGAGNTTALLNSCWADLMTTPADGTAAGGYNF